MKRLLNKEQIFTIPNLLSLIRLLLIPVILWLYYEKEQHLLAVVIIFLSGLTDIADGIIARKFNMVSDLGKILDPIADKLTQLSLICCFVSKFKWLVPLMILFVAKELLMGIVGYITLKKKNTVNSAQWFGKVNTFVLYAVMVVFFLFPGIPESAANALIVLCGATNLLALIKYLLFYQKLFRKQFYEEHSAKSEC